MGYEELTSFSLSYLQAAREDLMDLANGYQRRSEGEILELAAMAADLSTHDIVNLGLEPEPDRQVLEAFRRFTNQEVETLVGRSSEEIEEIVDEVKGIYFEVLVRDRLNSGETLGELQLEPGQFARLAGSTAQKGWDLEIIDRNGESLEQIQLKATESMSYVKEALRKYPNIRVAVPEEVDSSSENIIGTSISHDELKQTTEQQLDELSDDTIDNAVDVAAEFAIDIIPVTSALFIGITEGRRCLMGHATLRETMRSGGKRLTRASVYNVIGAGLTATGLGVAAIPVVMGLRVAETRLTGQVNLADGLTARTSELNQLSGLDG